MNVYKFNISLRSKGIKQDFIECVRTEFQNRSNAKNYKDYVTRQWDNLVEKRPNIGSLFSKQCVVASKMIDGDHYFVMDSVHSDSNDSAFLEILVLSSMKNVDESFNGVYRDISKTLNRTFKISMKHRFAWLFIYQEEDIYAYNIKLKGDIKSSLLFEKRELLRDVIFAIILFLSIIIAIVAGFSMINILRDICISIAISTLVFLLSELPVNISTKKRIMIRDFSNEVFDQTKHIENLDSDELSTPEI